jgi:hypothetical protein
MTKQKTYYVSTKLCTGLVIVENNLIKNTCPFWYRWIRKSWDDFAVYMATKDPKIIVEDL